MIIPKAAEAPTRPGGEGSLERVCFPPQRHQPPWLIHRIPLSTLPSSQVALSDHTYTLTASARNCGHLYQDLSCPNPLLRPQPGASAPWQTTPCSSYVCLFWLHPASLSSQVVYYTLSRSECPRRCSNSSTSQSGFAILTTS